MQIAQFIPQGAIRVVLKGFFTAINVVTLRSCKNLLDCIAVKLEWVTNKMKDYEDGG